MQWGHHSLDPYSATWANQRGSSTHQITLDALQVDSLRGGRNTTLSVLLLRLIQKHSIHAYDSAICSANVAPHAFHQTKHALLEYCVQ